ncbi:AsmA family protein [Amorphus coralli]|uniref:AsmA family protein n=1 Tax=Amorphus coralli TaxID=340680 RepID=UPI00035D1A3A|nr:AsmA family protein [Amorphus coralli]
MKRVLIALAGFCVLVVAALMALPLFVSTQWVRQTVVDQISQATGLAISIDGPVGLRAFPTVALSADAVRVRAPDGADVMSLETLRADLALIPLLSGYVTVNEIVLDGLNVALVRLEDGSITLPGLAGRTAATDAPANGGEETDPLAMLERLSVGRFSVQNGLVVLEDVASGVRETASDVALEIRLPGVDQPAHAEGSLVFRGRALAVQADIETPQTLARTAPTAVSLEIADGPVTGSIVGTAILADSVSFDGTLSLASANLSDAVAWASGSAPGVAIGEMSLEATAVMNPLALALTDIAGSINGTAFTGEITLPTATEVPQVRGRIAADRIDVARFLPEQAETEAQSGQADDGAVDLSALSSVDADLTLTVRELVAPEITLSGLTARALLQNGVLQLDVPQVGFGGGSVAFSARAFDENGTAVAAGTATVADMPLATLLAFAPAPYEASGQVFADVGFNTRGTTTDALLLNAYAEGSLGLRGGRISGLPLAEAVPGDASAGTLDQVSVNARFAGADQPVSLDGGFVWRGERFSLSGTSGPPGVLLSGAPSALKASLQSPRVATSYDGTISLSGAANGRVGLSTPSLRDLMAWLERPLGEGNGLQTVSIEGTFSATQTGVAVSDTVFAVDRSTGRGSGSVALDGAKPVIQADLAFDTLDLTPYLSGGTTDAQPAAGGSSGWSREPLDLSVLDMLDATLSMTTGSIVIDTLKTGTAILGVTLRGGNLDARLSRFDLYSGTGTGQVVLANDNGATTKADFTMEGVDVHRLFKDAAGFGALAGTGHVALSVAGAGDSVYALVDSLDGTASLQIADGAIMGINIPRMLRSLTSSILSGWQSDPGQKTDFTAFGATFQITDGVAATDDLSLIGPLVRMTGTGNADLAEKTLSFRVDPRLVANLEGQGSEAETTGLGVPIVIEGAWSGPRIYPDIQGILQDPQAALQQLQSLGNLGDIANIDGLGNAAGVVGQLASGDTQGAIGSLIDQQLGQISGGDGSGSGNSLQQALASAAQQQLGGATGGTSGGTANDVLGTAIGGLVGGLAGGQNQSAPDPVQTQPVAPAEAPAPSETLPAPAPAPVPDTAQVVSGVIGGLLGQQPAASAPAQATQQAQPQQQAPTTEQAIGGLVGGLLGQAAGQSAQSGNAAALLGQAFGGRQQQQQAAPAAAPQQPAPVVTIDVIPKPNPRR